MMISNIKIIFLALLGLKVMYLGPRKLVTNLINLKYSCLTKMNTLVNIILLYYRCCQCSLLQDCVCGFEFAGRTSSGRRVMGMSNSRCLSNTVIGDSYLLWDIPDEWTIEQAASVPVVYGTVSLSLLNLVGIRICNMLTYYSSHHN